MYDALHSALLGWYRTHGRHALPWRRTDDPYRIWISEIMLQQTQVKTVLERFYFPFLDRFPTLVSLADAASDDVLKQWEGLGYYTRARNLHRAAQISAPFLPETVEGLLRLPGIGKSTAHAIAAFAYGIPVPILDANVKRILYRFFGRRNADENTLWKLAWKLLDSAHPFEYNQALMDIGATICLPKNAQCDVCPLHDRCKAARSGDPLRYPAAKKRKPAPVRQRHILVFKNAKAFGLRQRQGKFLHGLWGFYERETAPGTFALHVGNIVQIYSHFRLEAKVWLLEGEHEALTFFKHEEIPALALSGADHKVLKLLKDQRFL